MIDMEDGGKKYDFSGIKSLGLNEKAWNLSAAFKSKGL